MYHFTNSHDNIELINENVTEWWFFPLKMILLWVQTLSYTETLEPDNSFILVSHSSGQKREANNKK